MRAPTIRVTELEAVKEFVEGIKEVKELKEEELVSYETAYKLIMKKHDVFKERIEKERESEGE